jgi:hypothetical protein
LKRLLEALIFTNLDTIQTRNFEIKLVRFLSEHTNHAAMSLVLVGGPVA